MSDRPTRRRRRALAPAVIALLLGGLGMLITLYATRLNGIGLSPDSARYVSAATEFAAGHGFTIYTGEKYVYQAPLYPALLGLTHRALGVDTLEAARLVNALVFGATVALAAWLVSQWFQSAWVLPLIAGGWVLCSPTTYNCATMAWTEPLFILLTLIFFWQMVAYLDEPRWRNFWLGAVAASLAALTRYVGIAVIATGVGCVFWWSDGTRLRRGQRGLLFGGAASLLPGGWLARNWIVSHTLTGERVPSAIPLTTNLRDAMTTALSWFTRSTEPPAEAVIILGWGVVIGLVAAYLFVMVRRTDRGRDGGTPPRVLLVYSLGYTALLIISATTTAHDGLNQRLLAPVFLPTMLLCLYGVVYVLRRMPTVIQALAWLSLGLWMLAVPVSATLTTSIDQAKNGALGYAAAAWVNSPTLQYAKDDPTAFEDAALYSNRPAALYLLLDVVVLDAPQRTYPRSNTVRDDLDDLRGTWPVTSPAYLIWFEDVSLSYYTGDDLAAITEIAVVADFVDGVIYRITRPE